MKVEHDGSETTFHSLKVGDTFVWDAEHYMVTDVCDCTGEYLNCVRLCGPCGSCGVHHHVGEDDVVTKTRMKMVEA